MITADCTTNAPPRADTDVIANGRKRLAAAAQWYAGELGWPVFPCQPRGKKPLTTHGFLDASTDADTIEKWWARWPSANIGVPAGEPSGIYVIDEDKAGVGAANLPSTLTVKTPHGRHYYYKYRSGLTKATARPGVDCVRTDGSYVIVPPSTHSGKIYDWVDPFCYSALADAPLLAPATPHKNNCNGTIVERRNINLTSIAGKMRHCGLSGEEMDAALQVANQTRCIDPLGAAEVRRIASNVAKYDAPEVEPADDFSPHVLAKRMSDVQPEGVEWLWPGRIPLGKLTLLAGDPGVGKSLLSLDLAARFSRGTPWPDDREALNEPGDIVILSAEDGLADTIRPRLDVAGADVSRIHAITGVQRSKNGEAGYFTLESDLPSLERHIEATKARLCIIDPISAYLGGNDGHSNTDVRGLLGPLAAIAEAYTCAVVCVTHLNKSAGSRAMYRAMGSLAFTAAARMVWLACEDQEDDIGRRRLLLPIKTNITAPPGGLAFEIVNGAIRWFDGRVDITPDEAMRETEKNSAVRYAQNWLLELLAGGPMESNDIFEQAVSKGISKRTLIRAKKDLSKVRARRRTIDGEVRWAWFLEDGPG